MLTPSRVSVPPTGSQETPVLENLQRTEEKLEIYIYTERERERERGKFPVFNIEHIII